MQTILDHKHNFLTTQISVLRKWAEAVDDMIKKIDTTLQTPSLPAIQELRLATCSDLDQAMSITMTAQVEFFLIAEIIKTQQRSLQEAISLLPNPLDPQYLTNTPRKTLLQALKSILNSHYASNISPQTVSSTHFTEVPTTFELAQSINNVMMELLPYATK